MLAPELDDQVPVQAHLRALVDMRRLALEREVRGELRPRRPSGEVGDVVDPAALSEHAVRADVVRLPERTRVGGDGEAAHLYAVPGDPGSDRDHRREYDDRRGEEPAPRRPEPPGQVAGEHDWKEHETRIAEDRNPADDSCRRRPEERAVLPGENCEQDECGEHQAVEHLPVRVHVVPDEVRVEGRQQRRDQPDTQ